ncbi:hypothetical protein AB0N81_12750 [Streptomyces sp. NPDC093510]|uniref:hypothetical protein n=1 Tax=Streptomyces sp. NPDC093510 TaxID=3155199 RepID=UPI00341E77ED
MSQASADPLKSRVRPVRGARAPGGVRAVRGALVPLDPVRAAGARGLIVPVVAVMADRAG